MENLLNEIRNCIICQSHLKDGVNPVLAAHQKSKIAIVGQAPGKKVHETGIPWDDQSGERLRNWLQIDKSTFYNPKQFAIIPMGFCYPGKGKSGDLPPRTECAPQWHSRLFDKLIDLELIVLVGSYSQEYYLNDNKEKTLTERVRNYRSYLPQYLVLPHPSPRNNIWISKNPWFEKEMLPIIPKLISETLQGS